MTNSVDHRLHHQLDFSVEVRKSDSILRNLLHEASVRAPKDLAPEMLADAGLTSARDLYCILALLEKFPANSPLQDAPLDVWRACMSQGEAMAHSLIKIAEQHMLDGKPLGRLNNDWAMAQVRNLKLAAQEARRAEMTPRKSASQIIGELQQRNRELEEELSKTKLRLEEAMAIAEAV